MNFVELRILYLIDVSRNFAVRSLKRNSEMQIYSKSEKNQQCFSYLCTSKNIIRKKVTDHRYDDKIDLSVFDNLF